MKRFRKILLATDFSAAARPAFRVAVDLARASRGRLEMVMAIPSMPEGATPRMYGEIEAFLLSEAERRSRPWMKVARAAGVRPQFRVLRGPAPDAVRRAARAGRADVVVIGTHGRTGLARMFVGSVASRVVATAPCPVVTVRPGMRSR